MYNEILQEMTQKWRVGEGPLGRGLEQFMEQHRNGGPAESMEDGGPEWDALLEKGLRLVEERWDRTDKESRYMKAAAMVGRFLAVRAAGLEAELEDADRDRRCLEREAERLRAGNSRLEEELAYAHAVRLRLEREIGGLREAIDGLGGRDGDIRNGKKPAYRQDVDCLEVHRLWKGGMTMNALAGRYGVHRDTIRSRLREAEGLLGQAEDKGPAVDDGGLPS